MTCSEPGCGGTIEDGYCALCGTAPVASPPPVHQPKSVANGRSGRTTAQPRGGNRQAPPPPVPVPGACGETDCDGTIVDGYCDTCGTAPASVTGPLHSPSASTVSASGRTSSRSVRTRSGSARSAARGRLGAGLVDVPPVPRVDPAARRAAPTPGARAPTASAASAASRSAAAATGGPAATEGFCPQLRHPVLVRAPAAGRATWSPASTRWSGCLAHGGLGWIYLARDRDVSDRWVVLKGLLDTGDPDAHGRRDRRAPLPRRGRAPQHRQDPQLRRAPRPRDGDPGRLHRHGVRRRHSRSKEILPRPPRRDGRRDPLPVAQAIAYALEMLPALGYLHEPRPAVLRLQARQRDPDRGPARS